LQVETPPSSQELIHVVKALVIAHEAADFYGDILRSTKGVIFMGTPHRGSSLASFALLAANLINTASFSRTLRKDLLKNLEEKSEALMEISRQFVHRTPSLKIISFIEQEVEPPLTTLV
jgi:hypothetical protein